MEETFEKKSAQIQKIFAPLTTEQRYDLLIEMGRKMAPYPSHLKTENRIVSGCQSLLYLDAEMRGEHIFFRAHSEALISAGLAALLIALYSNLSPTEVLTKPPLVIKELDLIQSLSLSRSNGFAQNFLRMKQLAVQALNQSRSSSNA